MATTQQYLQPNYVNSSLPSYYPNSAFDTVDDYRALAPQFAVLSHEDRAFGKIIKSHRYGAGDVIATYDDLTHDVLILIKGRVNLVWRNDIVGRQLVMSMLEPGAVLNQQHLSNTNRGSQFVEAVEDCVVWSIPSSQIEDLITRYPILSWGLLQTYAARLLQVEDHMEAVTCKKLPERVAELLLALDHNEDGMLEGVSHQMLADHLGTYRETVSSILREFKRNGLLKLGYRRIQLLDHEKLEVVAGIW
ncbi:MAG TPA: Crp/Fnr family transcriptional regulator [Caldilineaceae bacterium]|nr:Crp/Fnr family transcriptional regulator [Caldilineaceae bacterium]